MRRIEKLCSKFFRYFVRLYCWTTGKDNQAAAMFYNNWSIIFATAFLILGPLITNSFITFFAGLMWCWVSVDHKRSLIKAFNNLSQSDVVVFDRDISYILIVRQWHNFVVIVLTLIASVATPLIFFMNCAAYALDFPVAEKESVLVRAKNKVKEFKVPLLPTPVPTPAYVEI